MFLWAERPGRSASFFLGGMTDSSRLNPKMIASFGSAAANDWRPVALSWRGVAGGVGGFGGKQSEWERGKKSQTSVKS